MKIRPTLAWVTAAILATTCVYPDDSLKVRNAAEAADASISYLKQRHPQNAPGAGIQWKQKTVYTGGPVDLVTTSEQFTSETWSVEVSQSFAPVKNIVYQVTVFSPKLGWYWKGSVRADGRVTEETAFRELSEEERKKTAEGFLMRSNTPPPRGGYAR